jgi:Ni/Fe-hydrogenase subunit HybB-like protein
MLMAGYKLSPLWSTGFLPLLFLLSAVTMGYGVVIVESSLAALIFKRPLETKLLSRISAVIPWLLIVYLVVRVEDVNLRGLLPLAFSGGLKSNLFLLENTLLLLPMFILIYPNNRKNPKLLFTAACSLLVAGGLYRFNTYIIGFDPGTGWQYFPSAPEILITFSIIAIELMGYLWFVKRLPVLPALETAKAKI